MVALNLLTHRIKLHMHLLEREKNQSSYSSFTLDQRCHPIIYSSALDSSSCFHSESQCYTHFVIIEEEVTNI